MHCHRNSRNSVTVSLSHMMTIRFFGDFVAFANYKQAILVFGLVGLVLIARSLD